MIHKLTRAHTWVYYLCAAMVVVSTVAAGRVDGAGRTVRVGVYQNKPKVFMDENGHAPGFFIDLLDEIAVREGRTLVYVLCEWVECLAAAAPTGSLEEAFKLAGNGSADAAIANHFFGDYFYQSYGLVKTPIVFNAAG